MMKAEHKPTSERDESIVSKKPSVWTRIVCFFACKGVHIYPLMGSGLDTPCPRCGRTRYIG